MRTSSRSVATSATSETRPRTSPHHRLSGVRKRGPDQELLAQTPERKRRWPVPSRFVYHGRQPEDFNERVVWLLLHIPKELIETLALVARLNDLRFDHRNVRALFVRHSPTRPSRDRSGT